MPDDTVGDVRLRDPLSEVTRKERKFLLGISIISITLVKAGIVPTKFSALGVEFGKTDQQSLLWILGLITLYFLIAFFIYASSDFLAWRLAYLKVIQGPIIERLRAELQKDLSDERIIGAKKKTIWITMGARIVANLTGPVSFIRALFEFILPVVIGIYAIILVWTKDLPTINS